MIFNNYLYNHIIKIILNHLFTKLKNNYYYFSLQSLRINLNIYREEIINLSIVNKKWFHYVSQELKQGLSFRNYECLLPFIKDSKYSLIQETNSIKYYKSLKEYKKDKEKIQHYNYKRIRISTTLYYFVNLVLSKKESFENFDNVDFNIAVTHSSLSDVLNNGFKVNQVEISRIEYHSEVNPDLFYKISRLLKPKRMILSAYQYGYTQSTSSLDISPLLLNSNLTDFNLISCNNDPVNYSKIDNNKSSLKSYSINLDYFKIIDSINKNNNISNNSLVNGWNSIIKTVSTNSKIKVLSFAYIKSFRNDDSDNDDPLVSKLDFSLFTKGFHSILTSPTCSIEILKLSYIDFYDQIFKEAFRNNKTITSIILISTSEFKLSFIRDVLPLNKRISNLVIGPMGFSELEKVLTLINKINNLSINNKIELFSLSILYFNHSKDIEVSILNIIKSFPPLNIKEFNFYFNKYGSNSYNSHQLSLNNYIISFNYFRYMV